MLKKSLLFFFLISLAALPVAFSAPNVSIEEMKGTVLINGHPAAAGEMINPEDQIKTGNDGSASIVIENTGSVKLGKDTTWSYNHFSMDESKIDFSAYLALGRLRANVKKLPAGSAFQVKTPTSVAAVRGTSFGLYVYLFAEKVYTQLDVFESAVQFSDASGQQSYVVEEGNSSTGNESGVITPPQSSGMETQKALDSEASPNSENQDEKNSGDKPDQKDDRNKKPIDGNGPGGGSNRKGSGEGSWNGIDSKTAESTMNDEFASANPSGDMEMGRLDKMDMMSSMTDAVPEGISQPAQEFQQEVEGAQETKQGVSKSQLAATPASPSGGPEPAAGGPIPTLS